MTAPHVISDDASLRRLVDTLLLEPAYAIDTEFVRERTYHPELALVQIAWPTGLALVDTLAASPRLLAPLFETDALAVMHAATQDYEILTLRVGKVPKRLFDTQIAGAFLGHGIASLATILRTVLAVEISKSEQLTDWTRRPLSNAALAYAASDVRHLLALHRALVDALDSRGRIEWAEEECDRLSKRELAPRDPETAWWKLKGKSNLTTKGQCVAQSVAALREREAERRNVLPRFVLPDLVVLALAQRVPRRREELEGVRGLDAHHLASSFGDALLAAIEAGVEMPQSARRVPPRGEGEVPAPLAQLAMSWVSWRAKEEDVEPSLVATRDEVEAFLAGKRDGRLANGFRHTLVGRDLERLRSGEVAIGVGPGPSLVLVPV